MGEGVIQDSPWLRGAKVVRSPRVQSGTDALLHHDEDQLGLITGEGLKAFEHLWDLIELYHF